MFINVEINNNGIGRNSCNGVNSNNWAAIILMKKFEIEGRAEPARKRMEEGSSMALDNASNIEPEISSKYTPIITYKNNLTRAQKEDVKNDDKFIGTHH